MHDTRVFLTIMFMLWITGRFVEHTPQPTWGQLWIGLAAWFIYDLGTLILKAYRNGKRNPPIVVDHPHPT